MMLRLIFLLLAVFVGVTKAQAQSSELTGAEPAKYQNKPVPPGATKWHCVYDGGVEIVCGLSDAGVDIGMALVDKRLSPEVEQVVNHAGSLAESLVHIPLHYIPFDMVMVGQLADAVMCHAREALSCGVVFGENLRDLEAQLAPETLLLSYAVR